MLLLRVNQLEGCRGPIGVPPGKGLLCHNPAKPLLCRTKGPWAYGELNQAEHLLRCL